MVESSPIVCSASWFPPVTGGMATVANELAELFEGNGFRAVRLSYPTSKLSAPNYTLQSLLTVAKSNIVHLHVASKKAALWSLPPAVAAVILHKPFILHYHGGNANDLMNVAGGKMMLSRAAAIVTPSPAVKKQFEEKGYKPELIVNGLFTSKFPYKEKDFTVPQMLSARPLYPHYNTDVLIEATDILRQKYPATRLTIAGDGPESKRLKEKVTSLNLLGNVEFTGPVSPSKINELYANHNILLSAVKYDNRPVSFIEAQSSGAIVIAVNAWDKEAPIKNGITGILTQTAKPKEIADAVDRIISDNSKAARISIEARAESEAHDWGNIFPWWLVLYRKILDSDKRI
ncbi:D-inositol-3-phosphate glycosyltransferase [uncultured archaeon]|nr:D-inositol-3-phosphate glycosyltransferase [uncultured archaeon]